MLKDISDDDIKTIEKGTKVAQGITAGLAVITGIVSLTSGCIALNKAIKPKDEKEKEEPAVMQMSSYFLE